jgi:hypothetical protein
MLEDPKRNHDTSARSTPNLTMMLPCWNHSEGTTMGVGPPTSVLTDGRQVSPEESNGQSR